MKNNSSPQSVTQDQRISSSPLSQKNSLHLTKTSATNKNHLIVAANKILSCITQLKFKTNYHDIKKLREYLTKELEFFQINAQNLNFNAEVIVISRYALSACIDETIEKTPWGRKFNWHKSRLITRPQQKISPGEHFFIILNRICQHPYKFIDLIELMYICLSFGFEGKFLHQPFEKNHLQQITESTYHTIRKQRGEIEGKILAIPYATLPASKKQKLRLSPLFITLFFSLFIMVGIWGTLNYLSYVYSTQLSQQLNKITPDNTTLQSSE